MGRLSPWGDKSYSMMVRSAEISFEVRLFLSCSASSGMYHAIGAGVLRTIQRKDRCMYCHVHRCSEIAMRIMLSEMSSFVVKMYPFTQGIYFNKAQTMGNKTSFLFICHTVGRVGGGDSWYD